MSVSAILAFVTYQLYLIEAFTTHGLSNPIFDVGIIGSRSKTQLFFDSPDDKSKVSKTQLFFDGPDEKSKFEINQRMDIIIAGLECGFWIALGYFAQAMALSTISSDQCAFICSLTVVVVPLISAVFFGKKVQPVNIISGIAAIMGVGVDFNEILHIQPAIADTTAIIPSGIDGISTMTASTALMSESVGWFSQLTNTLGVKEGDLIAFVQPIGFGISFMRIEHYVEKFKDTKNRVVTIAAAECIAVGFLSLLWVLNDFHGTLPNFEYMVSD